MLNAAYLLQCNCIIFQHNLQAHHCNCPILVAVSKFHCSVSWSLSQSVIYKQPLPLTHYCGNSDLQSVNKCSKISSSACVVFTSVLDVLGRPVRSPCTSSLLLLKTLCTNSWHAALLRCHHPRPQLTGSLFFMGKTPFCTQKLKHTTNVRAWKVSSVVPIAYYHNCKCYPLPKK
jgi:hypothetical protein